MTTNGSPFLLGPLGAMVPVDATPGSSLASERPRGVAVSGAGVRRTRRGRYAPRTWDLALNDVTPEAVTMLELAAQGLLGDVWLLDRADAAANMLTPTQVAGTPVGRPPVMCDGYALPPLATSGVSAVRTLTARAVANASVAASTPDATGSQGSSLVVPFDGLALMAFDLPELPPGAEYVSAQLVLTRYVGGSSQAGTVAVIQQLTAPEFVESRVTWNTLPTGSGNTWGTYTVASPASPTVTMNAPSLAAFLGTRVVVHLDGSPPAMDQFYSRRDPLGRGPALLINYRYTALAPAKPSRVHLRGGQPYTISTWVATALTSAQAVIEWVFTGASGALTSGTVSTPPGPRTGPVQAADTFTPTEDGVLALAIRTTALSGEASGLRVHEGTPDGRFYAGRGTPCRVEVFDPASTLKLWRAGEQRSSDYTVQLVEVGVPGEGISYA